MDLEAITLRTWSRDDLAAMADGINARIAEQGEGQYVTEARMAEVYDHLRGCDPATDIVVAVDRSGTVVGYARVMVEDVAGGPREYGLAFEGLSSIDGLAGRMLGWAIDRALAIAAGDESPDRRLASYAAEGSARERALLAAGFEQHGATVVMARRLDDLPERPLPAGLTTRPVEPSQLRDIWEADIEAFRDARDFVEQTEIDFARFRDEAGQGTDLWQIAWHGDRVVSQVRTRANPDEEARLGRRRAWTEDISTRREWRGKGVASALIAASLHQLTGLGYDEAALSADTDSPTGAMRLYESLGYRPVLRQLQYHRAL